MTYTDNATKDFIDALSQLENDVTVIFYGDHLPGLYPDKAFKYHPNSQFETDYFIWSNHDNQKLDYPYLNSSDFIAALYEHTNSKLTDMLKEVSANQYDSNKGSQEAKRDLELLQYDISLGKGYIQENLNFFIIGDT